MEETRISEDLFYYTDVNREDPTYVATILHVKIQRKVC